MATRKAPPRRAATEERPRRSALDQIQKALRERGYRQLSHFPTRKQDQHGNDPVVAFMLYTNGRTVLTLQEHRSGGCELYKPVTESLGVAETINGIPT